MDDRNGIQLTPTGLRFGAYVASALRYWEPRRLLFNALLAAVVALHFLNAPGSLERLSLDLALSIFSLAVLANVCYCTAYAVDIFVQLSGLDEALQWERVLLFWIGTAFAATLTHFYAQVIAGAALPS